MKAVVLIVPTKGADLALIQYAVPAVKPGWVLVRIHAFGLNHSEQILRLSEIKASHINKPIIPGIECAGEIADASDTAFRKGQKVISLMGGMGRSFNGSYAEFALLPAHHVFAVETDLSWEKLGAIPETWFTSWGSLFECLRLQPGDVLLVRGGTCALGYAAIQLAKALGCRVVATTHRESKLTLLRDCGADEAVLDQGSLWGKVSGITKVLELVGAKTLRDTLSAVEQGCIVCNTGNLGGQYVLDGFDPIKEIPNGVYLTGFFSNNPTQTIIDDIFTFLRVHSLSPRIGRVYDFERIAEACEAMDSGKADGKIVIRVRTNEGEQSSS
ncbi:MAG: zinc-binding dehydrogenase [Christensenellales bacterium]